MKAAMSNSCATCITLHCKISGWYVPWQCTSGANYLVLHHLTFRWYESCMIARAAPTLPRWELVAGAGLGTLLSDTLRTFCRAPMTGLSYPEPLDIIEIRPMPTLYPLTRLSYPAWHTSFQPNGFRYFRAPGRRWHAPCNSVLVSGTEPIGKLGRRSYRPSIPS
jgi:hypothetical protein